MEMWGIMWPCRYPTIPPSPIQKHSTFFANKLFTLRPASLTKPSHKQLVNWQSCSKYSDQQVSSERNSNGISKPLHWPLLCQVIHGCVIIHEKNVINKATCKISSVCRYTIRPPVKFLWVAGTQSRTLSVSSPFFIQSNKKSTEKDFHFGKEKKWFAAFR